jgi:hypothetical protein
MRQPFRLNFSKAKVLILLSICSVNGNKGESKDNIFIETYETASVFDLSKTLESRTNIKSENMVFYHSRKLMKMSKTLGEYGIHSKPKDNSNSNDFYRVKVIEKKMNKDKHMLSLGLNPSFYKINSVRKVDWNTDAPWYSEAQDGFNWIAYCKNLGCDVYKQMVIC